MKIIPAIDLVAGRVVRLKQGEFAAQRTFDFDALALARRYLDAGAEWLHLVDLDGARQGAPAQVELVARIAADARVQAGGGVRTRADVERLLAAGVARVVVGSVAVRAPGSFLDWLAEFGAERLCLALDLRRDAEQRWRPAVDAWRGDTDADFTALLDRYAAAGLRHVLCTDIDRDGMAEGPNLVLYSELAAHWPQFDWIASGGVRDRDDVDALAASGVAACVAGTALLDGSLDLEEIACSRAA
ncbi:HisA/HisF-related TIM barrel protein [Dokdonella sp.]|uniref:1-(5-phosphoribosyl)-5-[(5- phosphoribosylamino)methylideneamino]imidazole-4- carboxamide isomerase n=1 Tax=Dokdonella sp. TaxID=2291710 RepID=UPI001B2B8202|nr:HisA/HisF-related TIM barrel protein [Dokdonella sp.]MBO9663178.1 1-(5-phosphoribosyl)-5-((5-phosphoribosylamino)methylideneamino)imidazole-4-carboxamide isomerase [Dokdonella sp.]